MLSSAPVMAIAILLAAVPGCLSDGAEPLAPDRWLAWREPGIWAAFPVAGLHGEFEVHLETPRDGFLLTNAALDEAWGQGHYSLIRIERTIGEASSSGEIGVIPGITDLRYTGDVRGIYPSTTSQEEVATEFRGLVRAFAPDDRAPDSWTSSFLATERSEPASFGTSRISYAWVLPTPLNATPLLEQLSPFVLEQDERGAGAATLHRGETAFHFVLSTIRAERTATGRNLQIVADVLDRVTVTQQGANTDIPQSRAMAGSDLVRSFNELRLPHRILGAGGIWESDVHVQWGAR